MSSKVGQGASGGRFSNARKLVEQLPLCVRRSRVQNENPGMGPMLSFDRDGSGMMIPMVSTA
jgi:hypothetical protein